MLVNQDSLESVNRILRDDFKSTYETRETKAVDQVATVVPVTTETTRFDFLADGHEMREWVGSRIIKQLSNYNYSVSQKSWEQTIEVDVNHLRDDVLGLYQMRAKMMGESAAKLMPREVYGALTKGNSESCFDGQPMFDTDHPVGSDGDISLVSNYFDEGGDSADSPWYMLDTTRFIKPIVVLEREAPEFNGVTDHNGYYVFMNRKYLYGAQARMNVGFGLWQTAARCEAMPTRAKIQEIQEAMEDYRGDNKNEDGRRGKLGITPNLIVCGSKRHALLKELLEPQIVEVISGTPVLRPNPIHGVFQLLKVTWLP